MVKFKLTSLEETRAQEFKNKHNKSCRIYNEYGFPTGPLFTYSFTGTGIGTCVEIKCSHCKEQENITDIDSW